MNRLFINFGDKYSPNITLQNNIQFKCDKKLEPIIPQSKITIVKNNSMHHLSYFIIKKFFKGTTLLLIDHHLDLADFTTQVVTCGNWVTCLLKEKLINKVFYLDLENKILPYERNKLKEYNFIVINDLSNLPKNLYISIDLDILDAKGYWDPGNIKLEELDDLFKKINSISKKSIDFYLNSQINTTKDISRDSYNTTTTTINEDVILEKINKYIIPENISLN